MAEIKKVVYHKSMWKSIPIPRRLEMIEEIKKMPNNLDKEILTFCFINDMSTAAVAEYIKNNNICIGKQGKPLSVRRIQQICEKYFPDCFHYYARVSPSRKYSRQIRKGHTPIKIKVVTERKCCEMCGGTEQLELHHDVPLSNGGDNDPQNLYVLCHKCHTRIEDNRRRIALSMGKRKCDIVK